MGQRVRAGHVQFDTRTCVGEVKCGGCVYNPVIFFPYFFLPLAKRVPLFFSLSLSAGIRHVTRVTCAKITEWTVTSPRTGEREKKREKERKRECWLKSVRRIARPSRPGSGVASRASRRRGDAYNRGSKRVNGFDRGLRSRDKGSQEPSLNGLGVKKASENGRRNWGWCISRVASEGCFKTSDLVLGKGTDHLHLSLWEDQNFF